MNATITDERDRMKRYWKVFKPSIESMMLDHNAQYMVENEQNELLSYLPNYKDKNILELGAGIGRFTSEFAKLVSHVTAVDFMESFMKQNKANNDNFGNIKFCCSDVMKLDFPDESFDIVFSNWLLMYLSDAEVETLMKTIAKWLKPGGYFFFRESCYHQSGNLPRPENPTKYRNPLQYVSMLQRTSSKNFKMQLKFLKNIITPLLYYGNATQLGILTQKVEDNNIMSYSNGISKPNLSCSELGIKILKENSELKSFLQISPWQTLVDNIGCSLNMHPGERVLEVGCQNGDVLTYIVKNFGIHAHGIDALPEHIHTAIENQEKLDLDVRKKIHYESTNWQEFEFPRETYDIVLCLDFLLSKEKLIKLIHRAEGWLNENGKFALMTLVTSKTDILHSTQEYMNESEIFTSLKNHNFHCEGTHSETKFGTEFLENVFDVLHNSNSNMKTTNGNVAHLISVINEKINLMEQKSVKLIRLVAEKK